MITKRNFARAGLIAATLTAAAGAQAQDAEKFYKSRTINILVGTTPGGYYDMGARIVARHMGQFLPGNPVFAVQNQPGAGGLSVVNRLAHAVDKDGATIAAVNRGLPQLALTGDPKVNFDPLALTWLGSLTSYKDDAYLLVVNTGNPVKSLADIKASGKPLHVAGTGRASTNSTFALIARDVLGLNLSITYGFPGVAQVWLAMERGEVDGQTIDISAILVGRPSLWREGKLRPLLAFGRTERLTQFPDVPIGRELVKKPEDRALLEFAEMPFFMAFPFAAPPAIPAERAQALKTAFMKMTADPGYATDMKKLGILTSPIDGEAVRKVIADAAKTPEDVRKRFAKLLAE